MVCWWQLSDGAGRPVFDQIVRSGPPHPLPASSFPPHPQPSLSMVELQDREIAANCWAGILNLMDVIKMWLDPSGRGLRRRLATQMTSNGIRSLLSRRCQSLSRSGLSANLAMSAIKAVFRVGLQGWFLKSLSPVPSLSELDHIQSEQAAEGRGSSRANCLYHDVPRPGKSYPAHYEWDVIHHWFVSK